MEEIKVLSLDGGGVRGYLTAMLLENAEKELNQQDGTKTPLGAYFDLIAGTSTGAIIAGLLAIGVTASEIRAIYERDMPYIFSSDMERNILQRLVETKYSKANLEQRANEYFGQKTFRDVKTHLVVTSVDITNMTPRFHKSAYNQRYYPRSDELLASAILASASAPAYFPVQEHLKYSSYLVDGGVVANNPALVALIESFSFGDESYKDAKIKLLSVGTGRISELPYKVESLTNTSLGWINPMDGPPLVEILMHAQASLVNDQIMPLVEKLNKEVSYRRINPELNFQLNLDDAKHIDLLKNVADLNEEDTNWILTNLVNPKFLLS